MTMTKILPGVVLCAATLVGCGGQLQGSAQVAEEIYAQYEEAAQGRLSFTISTVESGRAQDIAGKAVGELLGVPEYRLSAQEIGTEIVAVSRVARDLDADEWRAPIYLKDMEKDGMDLSRAGYRVLQVALQLPGFSGSHRALEVCLDDRCNVLDPVVQDLSSYVEDRQRLLREGWRKDELLHDSRDLTNGMFGSQARVCSLNSRPTAGGYSISYPAITRVRRNFLGWAQVTRHLGHQDVSVSCYVSGSSCRSTASARSDASSCAGNIPGWRCACDHTTGRTGTTGSTSKAIAETRCTYSFLGSVKADVSIRGQGASIDAAWDLSGSVDANGGELVDSCSWH